MSEKITKIRGFRFAGIASGIKKNSKKDLGLIVADRPVNAAGVFTRNLVRAAPVEVSSERLKAHKKAQALLVNSGNANACTGQAGMDATLRSSEAIARALGIEPGLVLPSSTGVIGVVLPVEKIVDSTERLVGSLSEDGAMEFAEAILTTDRFPKTASETFKARREEGAILGIAKGAGMIHPDMATTLGFILTDVSAPSSYLRAALRRTVDKTLNRVSVDGDTSTNDSFYLLASGVGMKLDDDLKKRRFEEALFKVLLSLGEQMVSDGEGAEHAVTIRVFADTEKNAKRVAHAIGTSLLVKTALFGKDPNWGRIIAAAGRAGVRFDPARAEIRIGDDRVFHRGLPAMDEETEARAAATMRLPKYEIQVRLGTGREESFIITSDLGPGYVSVNADYRS